jgi:hypothetical protein
MKFITGIILCLFAMILFIFFFQYMNIYSAEDLVLNQNPDVIGGVNETCKSKTFEIKCAEGLECVLITTYPTVNGICMKVGTVLEENLISRPGRVGYVPDN